MGQTKAAQPAPLLFWQNSRTIRGSIKVCVWGWVGFYCPFCFISDVKIVHGQIGRRKKCVRAKNQSSLPQRLFFKYNGFFPQLRRRDKHIYMFFLRHIVSYYSKETAACVSACGQGVSRAYIGSSKKPRRICLGFLCYSSSSSCFAAFFFFTKSTANTMVRAMATASTESPTMALVVMLC